MSAVGIFFHFTGILLSEINFALMYHSLFHGRSAGTTMPLFFIVFALNVAGPIPSCLGASLVDEYIEEGSPRNPYWNKYLNSLAYSGASLFLVLAAL